MTVSEARRPIHLLVLAILLGGSGGGAAAQEAASREGALRVFFECSGGRGGACDQREIRTQIDWVNWVRDRQDALVHVIVTSQETGSGGSSYQLDFVGMGAMAGSADRLTYVSLGTDVRDETVRGFVRVLAVGLARFSLLAGAPTDIDVTGGEPAVRTDRLVTSDQVEDPWDFWVFRVDLSTDFSGESTRTNKRVNGGFEATRTTVDWRLEFEVDGSWRESRIELSDDTVTDIRRDWSVGGSAIHSLADHWSLGLEANVSAATRTNQDLTVGVGPALEFSVWPYEEAPRRSLRARYRVGLRHFNYEEETLFGFTEETRGIEELELSLSQRQPWGTVFANVEGSHYLHDVGLYRVSTGGFLSFRVVRGLNLRVDGRVSWIRDQIFLSGEGASDEDILLERLRLASDFDWNFGIGFSFQFGSIFNNVVNNRF